MIQESKINKKGQIKIPGYPIFEAIRHNSEGGSLLTAIHENLNPIFISGRGPESVFLPSNIPRTIGLTASRIL